MQWVYADLSDLCLSAHCAVCRVHVADGAVMTPSTLSHTHAGVMAMVGVQLLVGGLRFCMPPRWRSSWKMMHGLWGWATVGAGG
jgi:hypothetical protein